MSEHIFDAITNIDDRFIEEARITKLKSRRQHLAKNFAIAACLVLVVGIGGNALLYGFGGCGSAAPEGAVSESETDGASTFMQYSGPIFPMTMAEDNANIVASRNVDLDFAPYIPTEKVHIDSKGNETPYTHFDNEIIVTDSYTLTNTSDSEQTIELIYPTIADLQSEAKLLPELSVNGESIEATLNYGGFNGKFMDLYGEVSEEYDTAHNLLRPQNFEDYSALIGDGAYLENAYNRNLDLSQSVIVYKFTEHKADFDEGIAPTFAVKFTMTEGETTVLTDGFNGGSWNEETGESRLSYFIPQEGSKEQFIPRYIAVLGDDIENISVQGYQNGACEDGEEISGVSAKMERYECSLSDILSDITEQYLRDYEIYSEQPPIYLKISAEEFLALVAEHLYSYGVLSPEIYARYDAGRLDDVLDETMYMDRVIYSSFSVMIPANSTADIIATSTKCASYNFYGGDGDTTHNGYDMAVSLGSNFAFNTQTASINTHNAVDIVNENFGFELENGIDTVTLDTNNEHYYIEIGIKSED